jgi:hypothetical protein
MLVGGELTLTGAPGQGTTVTLRVPMNGPRMKDGRIREQRATANAPAPDDTER